jgi:hypothetical protein
VVKQRHQCWRQIDEALLAFYETFRQSSILEVLSTPYPDAIAMKLQVLNEQAQHLADS